MNYQLLHSDDRTLCFIGDTFHNHALYHHFKNQRECKLVMLEDVEVQSQAWIDQHQFMCAVTNVSFKKTVADRLANKNISWFSACSDTSVIHHNVKIGYNTLINHFNVVYADAVIGNNVTISNYVQISHDVVIGDFSHVSPYCYLCFTHLGNGTCVGLKSSFPGKPSRLIVVPEWTNFYMDSRVTKSIAVAGTYSGSRMVDPATSLDIKIL